MKTLFFLLVLANVAMFLWEYRQGVFSPGHKASPALSVHYQEQIRLVSEVAKDRT